VTIRPEAWDSDGFVVKMEFFANGEKIGEDIDGSDGWAIPWSYLPEGEYELPDDEYEFVARAIDNDGAGAESAPVHVRLWSDPPRR